MTLESSLQVTVAAEYRAINRPNYMKVVRDSISELHKRQLIYGLPRQTLDSSRAGVDWCI